MTGPFAPPAIQVLPPEIASRIAAGEVIERPASVVKELVENALDAGAASIDIRLEDGGRQLIHVVDDGCGMSPEQARLAIQRHATSKIRTADDLFRLQTYGFRGEALPSMASVSEFELITRLHDRPEGFRILIRGGMVAEEGAAAGAPGTSFRVSNLFANVPARLKFMKSAQTELSRSVDYVQKLALAFPHVAFTLRQGAQESFAHPGGDIVSALVSVFGRAVARELIAAASDGPVKVEAYLAPPTRTRNNRTQQIFLVNGRAVGNRSLQHALDEAYAGLLPHGRFPIAVVLVQVDPEQVDVNVHPRKAEVKFVREHDVHSAVFHTVRQALVGRGLVPRISPSVFSDGAGGAGAGAPPAFDPGPFAISQTGGGIDRERAAASQALYAPAKPTGGPGPAPESRHFADQRIDPASVRILGQIARTYIVIETSDGMAIIDQHVAHERVLYERFMRRATDNPAQMLAVPVTLELTRREALIVMERLAEFQKLGFLLEQFGPETVILRGVPAGIKMRSMEQTLRDMIEELVELTTEKKVLAPREAVVTSAACRAAIKAGDEMSEPDIRSLLAQLMECDNPYVCPHGRPAMVRLDHSSLEKIFQR